MVAVNIARIFDLCVAALKRLLTLLFYCLTFNLLPVPPDILDYPTSSDQVAREGANVTLRCAAHGVPTPTVVWRKEAGDLLPAANFSDAMSKIKKKKYLVIFQT